MEVSGRLHTPTTLLPGKESWYALGGRLGGPQCLSGHGDKGKKISSLLPLGI